MGLARKATRVVTLAAAAGLVLGGAMGVLAPAFAEAGPAAVPARAHAAVGGVTVTSVDLLGRDRLEVTVRFSNAGRTVESIDPARIDVTADGAALRHRGPSTAVVDLPPGNSVEETVVFDAPAAGAALALSLPGGQTVALG
jgi:hypothetical protein